MKVVFGSIAFGAGVLMLVSYAGALHPAGDSFAVIRWPLALVFAVCVFAMPLARWIRCMLSLSSLAVVMSVFWPGFTGGHAGDYDFALYQQNLLFSRTERDDWLDAVDASGAEFVTLQEVSGSNYVVLDALKDTHPTQVYCEFGGVGGVAVLSSYEAVAGSELCADHKGLAAIQVETPHGRVWLVSVHLHWPWPFGQAEQVERLIPVLEGLEGPVILAGDFNAVAWSHSVHRLAQASGTDVSGPFQATFNVKGYPIGIDHVLTGAAYVQEVNVMPGLGSDHNGLVAYLTRATPS